MSSRLRRQELRRAAGCKSRSTPYTIESSARTSAKPQDSKTSPCASPTLASRSAIPSQASLMITLDSTADKGMPSPEQYARIEHDYITNLNSRKQEKALVSQEMFDRIWVVLHDPTASKVGSPQFRWWVRKMFVLSYPSAALSPAELESIGADAADAVSPVVLHQNRPVALKEQIYEILCYCHRISKHSGRDKTTAIVREHYSWIPKELVARFVRVCPTCIAKKNKAVLGIITLDGSEGDGLIKLKSLKSEEAIVEVENVPPPMPESAAPAAPRMSLSVSALVNYYNRVQTPEYDQPSWPPSPGRVQLSLASHRGPAPQQPHSTYVTEPTLESDSPFAFAPDDYQVASSSKLSGEPLATQRLGSLDYTYGHEVLRPAGQTITLPPFTQLLADASLAPETPLLRPYAEEPARLTLNPSVDLRVQSWRSDSQRNYHGEAVCPSELVVPQREYMPQIDPVLLHTDFQMPQGAERMDTQAKNIVVEYQHVASSSRFNDPDMGRVLSTPPPTVTAPQHMARVLSAPLVTTTAHVHRLPGYTGHLLPSSSIRSGATSARDELRFPFNTTQLGTDARDDKFYQAPPTPRFLLPVSFERHHATETVIPRQMTRS